MVTVLQSLRSSFRPRGRERLAACVLVVALVASTSLAHPATKGSSQGDADGGLRRRGRLGLLFTESPEGLVVREVVRNSAGASAGFRPGDIVTSVDGAEVRDRWTLLTRMRSLRAGDSVRLGILRDGAKAEVAVQADEAAREGDLETAAEYRSFPGKNGRLRSVWSVPSRPASGALPAVLVVRGVGAPAADAPGNNSFRELAYQLARKGLVVVRFDAEGVGDSEGGPSETVDFATEVADATAALAHLRADSRVDPGRIVLLGQGTGGGVAAVVAERETVAGLVVVGTIARPLMEYATESRREQLALAGVSPEEIDSYVREHIDVFSRLGTGADLAPGTAGIVAADGTLLGKRPEYWRQYDAAGLAHVYSRLAVPVLNAIGEFDFVSCLGEHRAIADVLRAKNPTGTVLVVLDRTDHDLRAFDSREAAFEGLSSTSASANEAALSRLSEWILARVTRTAQ